ncbi:hypothetical protein AB0D04_37380 [Streptomyces sp. NPDC048483]|uniref:hypothetical protein n=1 Tax=Streptomyces sp. NPDC048483 TaxID=3154927 RepID=UPI00341CDCF0
MDLAGFGALAAALVAAVGIPATVLVGRWQMRAALRSADATSQAGLAQAQATYQAAVDQTSAQSTAAHAQWRRGIRRDAWSAFLLTIEDAVNAGHSAPSGAGEDFAAARRVVKTSLVVLELEGPPPVVTAAKTLRRTCNDYLELVEGDLPASRAWNAFHAAVDDERTNFADDTAAPVHDAQAALSHLGNLMRELRAPTGPSPWASFDPATEPDIAHERIESAYAAATEALAACPSITSGQARTLLHDAAHGGRGEMLHQRDDCLRFFEESRAAFLSAAQQHPDAGQ